MFDGIESGPMARIAQSQIEWNKKCISIVFEIYGPVWCIRWLVCRRTEIAQFLRSDAQNGRNQQHFNAQNGNHQIENLNICSSVHCAAMFNRSSIWNSFEIFNQIINRWFDTFWSPWCRFSKPLITFEMLVLRQHLQKPAMFMLQILALTCDNSTISVKRIPIQHITFITLIRIVCGPTADRFATSISFWPRFRRWNCGETYARDPKLFEKQPVRVANKTINAIVILCDTHRNIRK